jgi:hypothetical protein
MPASLRSHLAEGFSADLLAPFDVAVTDAMPASVCGLWPDLRIGYVNPAWLAFGRANGAAEQEERWGLGANVRAVTPEALRPFYDRLFARAREIQAPLEHDYECPSPTQRRTFRMRVHPTIAGAFLVVHSVLRQEAHDEETHAAIEETYRDANGLIEQCAHCRRVRRARWAHGVTAEWDWVPDYVARMPPRTSHGLCAMCIAYFYPPLDEG